MTSKHWVAGVFVLVCTNVLRAQQASTLPPKVDSGAMRRHMEILAADSMRGRSPESREYLQAANYVAKEFDRAGLKRIGNHDWLYPVRMRLAKRDTSATRVSLVAGNRSPITLSSHDYLVGGDLQASRTVYAPLVFVGYGIESPQRSHDDYRGLNVRGAIVAFAGGAPAEFSREERSYHSELKRRVAAKHGAVGTIELWSSSDTTAATWDKTRQSYEAIPTMGWRDDQSALHESILGGGTDLVFGPVATKVLLNAAGFKTAAGIHAPTSVQVNLKLQSGLKDFSSPNVVGVIPGTTNEFVVVSAHLDHLGVGRPVNGDSIYNGAIDNASGVATIIEVARTLSSLRTPPRRSILFVAFTAEEAGGLGSEAFVNHSPVPAEAIVADLNIDGGGAWAFDALVARGRELTTLGPAIDEGARAVNVPVVPDPVATRAAMTGSDQFSFALKGIPAIAFAAARSGAARATALAWVANRYHQPTDDLAQPIDYSALARYAEVIASVTLSVANSGTRPAWTVPLYRH